MASATESMPRSPFAADRISPPSVMPKSIPILPSSSSSAPSSVLNTPLPAPDPMELTPSSSGPMPPPTSSSSPVIDRQSGSQTNGDGAESSSSPNSNGNANVNANGNGNDNSNGSNNAAVGAAAAAQQPKVVQTAFIHKLYNMLEDQTIQHLISWSNTNESFVMSPSTEFSKVLSSYFKHTNISSFVRQLNMYGFHKVSDVFHTGAPDSTLWEFRHGNGNFKRGDLVGLREIKRRASRHALIHRDSFSTTPKASISAQGGQTADSVPDPLEQRLTSLEHNYFDTHARLARSEDSITYLTNRCHILTEGLLRCHQWNLDLATYLSALIVDPENQVHKDVLLMQREIARQTDMLRNLEASETAAQDPRQPPTSYLSNHIADPGAPLSPRQLPNHDLAQRRPSQPTIYEPRQSQQQPPFRTPMAPHISISPRRYGSIGSSNPYSPSSARAPVQPPPPPPPTLTQTPPSQHPLATVSSPPANLSRRHTSADIRLHGWQGSHSGSAALGNSNPSPYASGNHSSQWPSSPARVPLGGLPGSSNIHSGGDQALRDVLAQYELPRGPASSSQSQNRHSPPPPHQSLDPAAAVAGGPDSAWSVPGSRYPGFGKMNSGHESGGTPTRRSSMASNLHGLLNPPASETVEELPEVDCGPGGPKRKRLV